MQEKTTCTLKDELRHSRCISVKISDCFGLIILSCFTTVTTSDLLRSLHRTLQQKPPGNALQCGLPAQSLPEAVHKFANGTYFVAAIAWSQAGYIQSRPNLLKMSRCCMELELTLTSCASAKTCLPVMADTCGKDRRERIECAVRRQDGP
jgi:hypothetical protein